MTAKCDECPLKGERKVNWQRPYNTQFNVMFVGQNPGRTEVVTGIPFTGKAGKMTYRLMASAGLDKRRAIITNVVCCPTEDDRVPTKVEVECCKPRLKEEIKLVKPDILVAFGKPALEALTGKTFGSMEGLRGQFFKLDPYYEHDAMVLATFHPAFVMRQRQWIDIVSKDLSKVVDYYVKGFEITDDKIRPKLYLDPGPSQLAEFFGSIKDDDVLVYDIETNGLNPRHDKILGIAYCSNPSEAFAVHLSENDPRWEIIERVHTDRKIRMGAQNGSFDYAFLLERGIETNNIYWDTRLAETLLHPDMPKDLQSMRALYTNVPPYKPSKKEMLYCERWPKERLLEMACWDVITTHLVMTAQKERMTQKEMNLKQNLLIPLIPAIYSMERKGVRVDKKRLAGLYGQKYPEQVAIENELMRELGINPASPKQICERFGLRDSTEETLKSMIRARHPESMWFEKILKYRQLVFILGTGLRGVYERLEGDRIHTSYLLEGTATGRLASRNPNLQNQPRWLRMIYIPDDDEHWFCDADFKQQELRVGALMAPEPTLLKELEEGKIVYERLRQEIFGKRPEEEDKYERQITQAKGVVFGTLYGRTAHSIAREFGVTVAEAERWQSICVNRFPGLLHYKRRCENDIKTKGYVETPFGRRRHVSTMTQGYNTPIQSASADVSLTVLLNVWRKGFDLRLTVHDSLTIQIKKGDLDAARAFKEACEMPFDVFGGYRFAVDIKVGPSWGENELAKVQL